MNHRQKELMQRLLKQSNEWVHVHELADELECSDKTIRNDLARLGSEFSAYSSLTFMKKPGTGVSLVISQEGESWLYDQLNQTHGFWEHEQIAEITYQLLVTNQPLTLTFLAEKYYTNKVTIKRYFDQIADWLRHYDLELVSRQRLGSLVRGSELNKRNALAHLSELVTSEMQPKDYVLQLFPEYEINAVRKVLGDLQAQFSLSLNTGEFESLLIHALIMMKRTRQRSSVEVDNNAGSGQTVMLASYHMAAWFLRQLEEMLGSGFPENEYMYFTWHLESCKQTQRITGNLPENSFLIQVAQTITQQLEQMTMLRFREDRVLFDGMIIHLESAINRLQYGFTIRNPMLEEIKKNYPYMFSMVIFALEEVNEAYDLTIPEHEAAYLVLHFQASLERMQQEPANRKRAIIVCELGVGMSHLLQAKLERTYQNLDILASVGKTDIASLKKHEADIIISTTAIPDASLPVIVVSPLLETDDKKRLNQWLHTTDDTAPDSNGNIRVLGQLLHEDAIFLDMRQTHRFEVVEIMASHLAEKGYTGRSFVHSAMQREQSSATSIGGAVAIPHAHPDLVNESVVSMAVLQEPLLWGNKQVSVVFLLAISKEDQHKIKRLMQTIASISQQPAVVEQLKEAKGISDILATFDK